MFLQLQTQELLQPVSARSGSVTHSIENGLGGVPAALALLAGWSPAHRGGLPARCSAALGFG
jgi:hypothetical protein